jgi:hypothetical protein
MKQEDIIRMAREAGFMQRLGVICIPNIQNLERFAALVAATEREACAELLESRKTGANELMDAVRDMEAAAIRARGQA